MSPKSYTSRIDQVDAQELDAEIFSIWKSDALNIFKYLKPGITNNIEPELNALLRLVIWKISVKAYSATIGQQLLSLQYGDDKSSLERKLYLYALGIVGGHWLKDRSDYFGTLINNGKERHKKLWLLQNFLDWGEILWKLGHFANFLIFLRKGHYISLAERILKLRTVPATSHSIRQLDYDYMGRELLWHGFAEFTTFLVPYVNWQNLRKRIGNILGSKDRSSNGKSAHSNRAAGVCEICEQPACAPQSIGCNHVFCYYCITSQFLDQNNQFCPACSREFSLDAVRPL